MTDAVVVLTTVVKSIEGDLLIKALLDRRFVACDTMLPSVSCFVGETEPR